MPEQILTDYEVSDIGAERLWSVPYARLEDATPTVGNPAALKSRVSGEQAGGVVKSIDAGRSLAVVDLTPKKIYKFTVRNVLTYAAGAEATFGAINVGDTIYYDRSATMPAGTYLSTSPLDKDGGANPVWGHVVPLDETDTAAKGGATASTQTCAVAKA